MKDTISLGYIAFATYYGQYGDQDHLEYWDKLDSPSQERWERVAREVISWNAGILSKINGYELTKVQK